MGAQTRVGRCWRVRAAVVAGLAAVAMAGPALSADDTGGVQPSSKGSLGELMGRRAREEKVVVYAKWPDEVWSGVIQIQVVDKKGAFLHGLTEADFRLNKGKVSVDSVKEVEFTPAVLFMIDYTVSVPEAAAAGMEEPDDPRPYYAELIKAMCERFPHGISAVSFLTTNGVFNGTFVADGEEISWLVNSRLLELIEESPEALFPPNITPAGTDTDKYLSEWLEWMARRFDEFDSGSARNFLFLFSDLYEGDPGINYRIDQGRITGNEPRQLEEYHREVRKELGTESRPGGESRMREQLWDRKLPSKICIEERCWRLRDSWAKAQDELRLGAELSEREIRPVFLSRPMDKARKMELWDKGEGYRYAAKLTRDRYLMLADRYEGASLDWQDLAPDEVRAELAAEIEKRLSFYWIAWSTPETDKEGETFLDIKVRSDPPGKAVPAHLGSDLLLAGDPYHVRYQGPREKMPWEDREVLFPEEADRLTLLATKVSAHLGPAAWQWDTHCPYVLITEMEGQAPIENLAPLLLSAYRQTYGPQGEDMPRLWAETEDYLAGTTRVDLCDYAAHLDQAGKESAPEAR